MSRIAIITSAALLAAAAAGAMNCSIVSSFQVPGVDSQVLGLDYYGGKLYFAATMLPNVYITDFTGSLLSSFTPPWNICGIEVDSGGMWLVGYTPSYVYRATTSGSILSSFPHNYESLCGVTSQGDSLWFTYNNASFDELVKTTTSGSVIASYVITPNIPKDLDFDGEYLWVPNGPLDHMTTGIYLYTTTGSLVDSVIPYPGVERPGGLCWDGAYLWAVDVGGVNKQPCCYRMSCEITYAVEPASLGKVKALFR